MNLNEAYSLYLTDPQHYMDPFGVELLNFCKAFQKNYVRDDSGGTSVSSWYSTDDAANEAILKIWQHLPEFNPKMGASFSTWAGAVLTNSIKNAFRDHAMRSEVGLSETVAIHEPHRAIEDKLTVKKLISKLNEADKSFVKSKMEGWSQEDLGKAFGRDAVWAKEKWKYLKKKFTRMAS